MKKIVLLLLLFITLPCFSQITRSFWGLSLGRSTKQQVLSVLAQKGYRTEEEYHGGIGTVNSQVFFGGVLWSYASFEFVNGVLSQVGFLTDENQSAINVDRVYNQISESLDNKYKQYFDYFPPGNDGSKISSYCDNRTTVAVMIHPLKGVKNVYLFYRDEFLKKKKEQNYNDEL